MIGLVSDRCLWLIETLVICHILLTTIGLTPGGSSTVHIYAQTIHRTTKWNRIHRTHMTIKIHKCIIKNT